MMIPMSEGISLLIREPEIEIGNYPACRIQKGPVLVHGNKDMSEEGLGFGVPILKFGQRVIFPGRGHITSRKEEERTFVKIDYDLNLAETMSFKGRRIKSSPFYRITEYLSGLHREYPFTRELLTQSSIALRQIFEIETEFEEVPSSGLASVEYDICTDGMIHVSVDLSLIKKEGCTEVMIMNEQGANYFDTYCDSKGTILVGNAIGSWQENSCDEVSFIDSYDGLTFTLPKIPGSKMFYGRELVENHLAWSGIAYSLSPHIQNFAYDIKISVKK